MNELLIEFITETNENIRALDLDLVKLERDPHSPGLVSSIFRLVHTIKGTCGFLDLPRLEKLAHAAENVLGRVRDGQLVVTPSGISAILGAIDGIKLILGALEETESEPVGDDNGLILALDVLAAAEPETDLMTEMSDAVCALEFDPVPQTITTEPTTGAEPHARESAVALQTIRVNVNLLETLMTTVSELVLTRNQLLQIARGQKETEFAAPLQRLSHVVSELQEGVMKTRMQPIGHAWAMLPRIVRDLGHETGKKIELILEGADTELDRQVLELIKDPLTHMVRNSADHGIEPPAERISVGKHESGTVRLNAFHQGGHIIIEVGDDGRGLNIEKIKAKLLAKGLATEADLALLTETQICQFIFRPGFSTADAITSVSGRGVGMDVVKTNIEKIGGSIEFQTKPGQGSKFTIRIPLTLAIISALIVDVAGQRFAIPQTAVLELVRVGQGGERKQNIERVNSMPVLRLRNRLLPLVVLRELFQLERAADLSRDADGIIVVASVGGRSFGMIVDQVFDTEEIVVKPVAPVVKHLSIFSGNTILGDGSVIMILDPGGIATTLGEMTAEAISERNAPSEDASRSQPTHAMIIFTAGAGAPKAMPLSLVARLEAFDASDQEWADGRPVIQYRGKLTPLVPCDPAMGLKSTGKQQSLILSDQDRSMALLVDSIVDIVETPIEMHSASTTPGIYGSAIIAGRATDLIDASHYVKLAFPTWFEPARAASASSSSSQRVLIVDDSAFFRELVSPLLSAEGYAVTTAANASDAMGLHERGELFDVILSDLEMPSVSGFDFASHVKQSPRWRDTPLLALSGHQYPDAVARAEQCGFQAHIAKFDRTSLLRELTRALPQKRKAA